MPDTTVPRGVLVATAFFAASGVLDVATSLAEAQQPPGFGALWEILGRGGLHFLLAAGLWNRIAVCRQVAMIYCLAALVTYAAALALAFARLPLRFGPSVVMQSLFQVPSCALLLPYLRSPQAAALFTRPLLPRS